MKTAQQLAALLLEVDAKDFVMNAELVPCPPCKGTGKSQCRPDTVCPVCDGSGTIMKERAEMLAKIKRDIARRLSGV